MIMEVIIVQVVSNHTFVSMVSYVKQLMPVRLYPTTKWGYGAKESTISPEGNLGINDFHACS